MLSVDEKSLLIATMTMKMRKLKTCQVCLESGVIVWDCNFLCKAAQALHERPPSTHTNPPVLQCEVGRCQNLPQSFQGIDTSNNELNLLKKIGNELNHHNEISIVYNAQKLKAIEGETFPFPQKKLKFLFAPSQLSVYYLESRNHHRLGSLSQAGTRGVPVQLR